MLLISHRGNLTERRSSLENHPDYIDQALEEDFNVEIDVWLTAAGLMLGHDKPQFLIDRQWLIERKNSLWCHAKSVETLIPLMEKDIHCFFHDKDDVTLTSWGYLWTYPGKHLTSKSIAVMPSILNCTVDPDAGTDWWHNSACFGICDDNIKSLKDTFLFSNKRYL